MNTFANRILAERVEWHAELDKWSKTLPGAGHRVYVETDDVLIIRTKDLMYVNPKSFEQLADIMNKYGLKIIIDVNRDGGLSWIFGKGNR